MVAIMETAIIKAALQARAEGQPEATTPTEGTGGGMSVSNLAKIIGLTSVFALAILIGAFFIWRRRVRSRPGYENRKIQRKRGMSVVACHIQRFWAEATGQTPTCSQQASPQLSPQPSMAQMEQAQGQSPGPHIHFADQTPPPKPYRAPPTPVTPSPASAAAPAAPAKPVRGRASDNTSSTTPIPASPITTSLSTPRTEHSEPSSPATAEPQVSSPPTKTSRSASVASIVTTKTAASTRSYFRPCTDVLPPKLCKTYTWQQEPGSQPDPPLTPTDLDTEYFAPTHPSISPPPSDTPIPPSYTIEPTTSSAPSPTKPVSTGWDHTP
ncbi:hypothetical protein DFS34DRAFT_591272 [Phlyctochytrium arcticum]|nr:hypothetical protein DFS34DRAFT_591272 [Phlyctochytrium arcticum]